MLGAPYKGQLKFCELGIHCDYSAFFWDIGIHGGARYPLRRPGLSVGLIVSNVGLIYDGGSW